MNNKMDKLTNGVQKLTDDIQAVRDDLNALKDDIQAVKKEQGHIRRISAIVSCIAASLPSFLTEHAFSFITAHRVVVMTQLLKLCHLKVAMILQNHLYDFFISKWHWS